MRDVWEPVRWLMCLRARTLCGISLIFPLCPEFRDGPLVSRFAQHVPFTGWAAPSAPERSSFRWSSLQMVLGFGVKRVGRSWNPGFFVICFGSSLWCYLSLQALMVSLLARRMVGFPTDRQLSLKMLPISCPQEISWFWFLFLFKNFLCFIFMCTGVSAYTNVCALRACSACWGQKRALDPPGQKSKWLWAAMWMQGIKS